MRRRIILNDMGELDETDAIGIAIDQESKPKSFAAAELMNCDACSRANPPTRSACLYCGAPLATTPAQLEVSPRAAPAEQTTPSGDGQYVVLIPRETNQIEESTVSRLASLLQVKTTEVQNALSAGGALPVQLAKSAEDANRFGDDLRALGLSAVMVSEAALNTDRSFPKVRALEISAGSLTGLSVSSSARFTIAWSDMILLVNGRLITTQTEIEEKRRGQSPSDGRQNSFDEPVLDIWTNSNVAWRIFVNSFDFSCLGPTKSLTAFDNSKALLQIFRERAPNAHIDESYARVRPILANVWPLDKQTRNAQLRHTGIGKRQITTVTATDNQAQFNGYSRLMHHLRLREMANHS